MLLILWGHRKETSDYNLFGTGCLAGPGQSEQGYTLNSRCASVVYSSRPPQNSALRLTRHMVAVSQGPWLPPRPSFSLLIRVSL